MHAHNATTTTGTQPAATTHTHPTGTGHGHTTGTHPTSTAYGSPAATDTQYHHDRDVGTTSTTHTKGHKTKRGLAALLAIINATLFALMLALCAYLFNQWANRNRVASLIFSDLNPAGTAAQFMLIFSFLAGAVGLATMIMAIIHAGSYSEAARYSALSGSLVTFGLVCLAAGFGIQALCQGHTGPKEVSIAITIAVIDIVLVLTMLTYLVSLGLFKNKNEYNSHYTTSGREGLPTHHTHTHQPKYAAGHEVAPSTVDNRARVA